MNCLSPLGIDPEDSLSTTLKKVNEMGCAYISVTTSDEEDKPLGMFLVVSDPKVMPYVERALKKYDSGAWRETP